MTLGIQAPEQEWSIYLIFRALADRFDAAGYDVEFFQDQSLSPRLRDVDSALVHYADFSGFNSDLWDDVREYTHVWSSGINYKHIPWERIPNPIAQSEWIAELMPGDPTVLPAGVDTDTFYPEGLPADYDVGAVGNADADSHALHRQAEIFEESDYTYYHHDGWNGDFVPTVKLRALYNAFDTYCFLSHFEGGNQTLLEAAACGCGVVSSRTGYAPNLAGCEVVDDHDADTVVAAVDRAEPFVEEIRANWSWDALFSRWEAVLT